MTINISSTGRRNNEGIMSLISLSNNINNNNNNINNSNNNNNNNNNAVRFVRSKRRRFCRSSSCSCSFSMHGWMSKMIMVVAMMDIMGSIVIISSRKTSRSNMNDNDKRWRGVFANNNYYVDASRAYPEGCSNQSPSYYDYDNYPFPPQV